MNIYDMIVSNFWNKLRDSYWEGYENWIPRNFGLLKKRLIPFEVTDEEFMDFLLNWSNSGLKYNGQELNLWSRYKALLVQLREMEKQLSKKGSKAVEIQDKIKKNRESVLNYIIDNLEDLENGQKDANKM